MFGNPSVQRLTGSFLLKMPRQLMNQRRWVKLIAGLRIAVDV
jgi:hypothetical protein